MASINSLSGSSSTSSIYGNANILSGLASGMDTEAMIENAVSGIQNKITSLQQDRTMIEWEQEAYRSIIDKMVNFANKYTSYSSSTNLLSEAFFRNALSVSTNGVNADKITASGRPTSSVQILGVQQLATAATYKVSGLGNTNAGEIIGDADFSLDNKKTVSTLSGSMTFRFGSTSATITFGEKDIYTTTEELVAGINKKLEETDLSGKVSAVADGENGFKFVIDGKQLGYGNNVLTISSVSGNLAEKLDVKADSKENVHNVTNTVDTTNFVDSTKTFKDLLETESITFTLDGKAKSISLKGETINNMGELQAALQKKLNEAFGTYDTGERGDDDKPVYQGNITVDLKNDVLSFSVKTNSASTLRIEGGDIVGLKGSSVASYTDLSTKLGESAFAGLDRINDSKDPNNGKFAYKINDQVIGYFDENSTLEDVMNAINKNSDSPVTVSFSKLSNQFTFTTKETGRASKITFGNGIAELFGATAGASVGTGNDDAVFSMSVDGKVFDGITRSSNSFEVDGMTIKLEGTFGTFGSDDKMGLDDEVTLNAAKADAVSFTAKTDSDKIVEAIKEMVKDYNEMANEIKDAYSTMPLYNSKGKRYEPLTEDDEKDMSESAVNKYNEKAKTGILFGDNILSGLYDEIRTAINELGMSNIGITTAFSDGKTTLVVDEAKLKETLNNDPEKVTEVFTKSRSHGSSSDGFMTKLKNITDTYTKTTGTKGILIDLVGSTKSPLSLLNNTYQSKLDKLDETILRWQDKLSDKIDYYNRQFTRLEQMISQMNSQSSSLMGLMGY